MGNMGKVLNSAAITAKTDLSPAFPLGVIR